MRLLMLRAAFISNVTSIASAPNCRDTQRNSQTGTTATGARCREAAAHHLSDPQSIGAQSKR